MCCSYFKLIGNFVPFSGVGPYHPVNQKDDIVFQSYYQWVSLLFLLQGFAFFVPHFFWRHLENGTMKSLRLCLNDPAVPNEKQAENLDQLVEYFQRNIGRHQASLQYKFVLVQTQRSPSLIKCQNFVCFQKCCSVFDHFS